MPLEGDSSAPLQPANRSRNPGDDRRPAIHMPRPNRLAAWPPLMRCGSVCRAPWSTSLPPRLPRRPRALRRTPRRCCGRACRRGREPRPWWTLPCCCGGEAPCTARYLCEAAWRGRQPSSRAHVLVRRRGVLGFYAGVGPYLLRVMPASCLTFVIYETVSGMLEARWVPVP